MHASNLYPKLVLVGCRQKSLEMTRHIVGSTYSTCQGGTHNIINDSVRPINYLLYSQVKSMFISSSMEKHLRLPREFIVLLCLYDEMFWNNTAQRAARTIYPDKDKNNSTRSFIIREHNLKFLHLRHRTSSVSVLGVEK